MTAYGYARASLAKEIDPSNSVQTQKLRIRHYYDTELKPLGVEWGRIECDGKHVPSFKLPLFARPAGRKLMIDFKPGDHLIVDHPERIWRGDRDFILACDQATRKGVTLHIINFGNLPFVTNTPEYDMALRLCTVIADMHSEERGRRTREGMEFRSRAGLYWHFRNPPGTRVHRWWNGTKTKKKLMWSQKNRAIMAGLLEIVDAHAWKYREAAPHIEAFMAKAEGRPERKLLQYINDWKNHWRTLYIWEAAYRYLNVQRVEDIPRQRIAKKAAYQHRRTVLEKLGKKHSIPVILPEQLMAKRQ